VIVELPALEDEAPATAVDAREAALQSAPLRGLRVLLVEDDDDTRELLAAALQAAGAEVHTARTTWSALQAMNAWPPHAIVSDIAMPGEDGYAFIRQVRARPAGAGGHTPAIALTALAGPGDREHALGAGFQLHLAKPIDPGELVLAVATLRGEPAPGP
jgi:CheY-like chemotaxis protein